MPASQKLWALAQRVVHLLFDAWYLVLNSELCMISRIEIKKNYPIFSVPIGESGDYPLTKGLCRLSYWMVEVGVDP